MPIYILQNKKTGGVLWAGNDSPKHTVLAGTSREWVKTFWVIEVPAEGDFIYHNADRFLEAHDG